MQRLSINRREWQCRAVCGAASAGYGILRTCVVAVVATKGLMLGGESRRAGGVGGSTSEQHPPQSQRSTLDIWHVTRPCLSTG